VCDRAADAAGGAPTVEDVVDRLLTRVFEGVEAAAEARRALVEAGLAPDQIAIRPLTDEAGPMDANFITGNGRDDASRATSDGTPGFVGSYAANFQPGQESTRCVLEVDAHDEQQRRRADDVLNAARGAQPAHGRP
jgi:hypothetical protein